MYRSIVPFKARTIKMEFIATVGPLCCVPLFCKELLILKLKNKGNILCIQDSDSKISDSRYIGCSTRCTKNLAGSYRYPLYFTRKTRKSTVKAILNRNFCWYHHQIVRHRVNLWGLLDPDFIYSFRQGIKSQSKCR